MVRYEIRQGDVKISYGYDTLYDGLFLTVSDKRLKWSKDNNDEINELCSKIFVETNGCYLHLNTYKHFELKEAPVMDSFKEDEQKGFGYNVSVNTIIEFMRKYGAEEAHLEELKKNISQ